MNCLAKAKGFLTIENLCFAMMQAFYWAGFCILFAYVTPYLLSLGYTNTQVGVIVSANSAASVIGQPVFGYICDKTRSMKKVMALSFLGGALLSLGFLVIGENYYALLVLTTVIAFVVQAVYPLIDSWTEINSQTYPTTNYGVTRAIGSIGYAITSALAGVFFSDHGFTWIFPLFTGTMVLCLITCAGPHDTTASQQKEPVRLKDIGKLLGNYQYISFVVIATIMYIAYRSCHSFLAVLMESVGGTTADLGYAWSILGISEVPFLLIAGLLLKKMKDSHLILVSMFFFILRVFLPTLATTPTQLIWMTALQGLSYGLFLPASVHFIARVVPRELANTAQAFAVAMYAGIGISASGIIGGILADAFGIVSIYQIATVVITITTIAFAIVVSLADKADKKAMRVSEETDKDQ